MTFSEESMTEDTENGTEIYTAKATIRRIQDGIEVRPRCYLSSETIPPVMTYSALFSAEDESASGYRELTAKDFASWSDEQAGDFSHGDYSLNHIKDSVWITFAGYDEQSGVGEVQITETYYKAVDGVEINTTPSVSTIPISRNCKKNSDGSYSTSYKLRTMNDGVVKLEIALLDGCGNESNEKSSYYVIKDCSINTGLCKFKEFYIEEQWKNIHPRMSDSSDDSVTMTPFSSACDTFYGGYSTPFKLAIFYGYSQDSVTIPVEKVGESFAFTNKKPDLITYVKIICEDEVRNSRTIMRAIPPRPDFDISCCETSVVLGYGIVNGTTVQAYIRDFHITPYNYSQLQEIASRLNAHCDIYCRNVDLTDGEVINNSSGGTKGHDHKILPYFNFDFYDNECWYSTLPVGKYLSLKVESDLSYSSSDDDYREFKVVDTTTRMNSVEASSMPQAVRLSSQIENGSGCDRITVTNTDEFGGDYRWYLMFKDLENKVSSFAVSGEQEISLKTPGTYSVYLKAVNSEGAVYESSTPTQVYLNGTDSGTSFSLSDDATPPTVISLPTVGPIYGDSVSFYMNKPSDDTAIYSKDGLGELTYYFIPSSVSSVTKCGDYTLEELSAYEGKTITYDIDADKISIPYFGLNDGHYTVCVVTKDMSGNKGVKCFPAFNRMTEKSISSFYVEKASLMGMAPAWFIIGVCESVDVAEKSRIQPLGLKTDSSGNLYWNKDLYNSSQWIDKVGEDDYRFTNKQQILASPDDVNGKWFKLVGFYDDSYSTATSGFYGTEYIFPDYYIYKGTSSEIKCIIKNMVQGTNGVQVYCDAPTLVHTLYSTVKISDGSEDEDIRLWESKGMEVSIKTASQTFTYDRSNYQKVPKGCWYTTVAHFADGSKTMTEPSLKR